MKDITPIPTRYFDENFRSRLEVRWAIFIVEMYMDFEYEQRTFTDGKLWYLPDFWVPDLNCFIEAKPTWPTEEEVAKAELVVKEGFDIYFTVGPPVNTKNHAEGVLYNHRTGDIVDIIYCGTCDCARLLVCNEYGEMNCCRDPYASYSLRGKASEKAMHHKF